MNYEKYHKLWSSDEGRTVRNGHSASFSLNGDGLSEADKIFVTGESSLFYQWKSEPDYPMLYRRIDDSLDNTRALKNAYSLHLIGRNADYPMRACKKIMWPPVLSYLKLHSYTDAWDIGITARGENVVVYEGGYLRIRFEVRHKKEGVNSHVTWCAPDTVVNIDIPEGTYDWTELVGKIKIPVDATANVLVLVEGIGFDGDVWLEQPTLKSSNGYNILGDFIPYTHDKPHFNWVGQNLSFKEWPKFEIEINGKRVFCGEIFERSHRCSEWGFSIPKGTLRNGENTITFKLISEYRDPLPYTFREIGAISHGTESIRILAFPQNVTVGKEFSILIGVTDKNTDLKFSSSGLRFVTEIRLPELGLRVLKAIADEPRNNIRFSVNGVCATVDRAVIREEDGIITGTGDMVYINQNTKDMLEYICWYLNSRIGNLLTIRPTYRWSGSRSTVPSVWKPMVELLNAMDVKYVHMVDGRELPGINANPSYDTLEGKGFLGRQFHERDGAHSYWPHRDFSQNLNEELYNDMSIRMLLEYPETSNSGICPQNVIAHGDELGLYTDPYLPADMKAVAEHTINQLKRTRYNVTRHTGPSTLFKYFHQAGYTWTGAELMYGPMELVCAALRGTAGCYGSKQLGGHLALQWSTSPHDCEVRYRRYRLALYVAYMQGLTEINTEEGLWHMEEYYSAHHRFGEACVSHAKQQQDFFRYVSSHSRTGEFYTPIAFLNGRYDGWRAFVRQRIWGRLDFTMEAPEKSWDLINYYYPRSIQNNIYVHPCFDGPVGYYTGTPHGNIDILPIEASDYSRYKLLSVVGYNCALDEDMDKLARFVDNGGTLLIGWPQLSVTTDRQSVVGLDHKYIDHPFVKAIAGEAAFVKNSVNGYNVTVSTQIPEGEALVTTDEGSSLIYRVSYGKGSVYFINSKEYLAESAVSKYYSEILNEITEDVIAQEPSYIIADENVQFTVYRQTDGGRHFYLLNVNWFDLCNKEHTCTLRLGNTDYEISVRFGVLIKIVVVGSVGAWCDSEDGEVLSVGEEHMTVQGNGICTFYMARNGKIKTVSIDLTERSVQTFKFD